MGQGVLDDGILALEQQVACRGQSVSAGATHFLISTNEIENM
jgi:hypothetical protein